MIYLKSEQAMFEKVKTLFRAQCAIMTARAATRDAERGKSADLGSPIHHRMSPEGMAHEITKKGERVQRKQSVEDWTENLVILDEIVDDCMDVINYATFLGALCLMVKEDREPKSNVKPRPRASATKTRQHRTKQQEAK